MSELLLYIIATAVVLAGVAYFFVKQREQELTSTIPSKRGGRGKGKKEPKAKESKEQREPKEPKPRKARPIKEEAAPAPLTKRQLKNAAREEDEARGVLHFLKNKNFTSDVTTHTAQARIRTAPTASTKEPAKTRAPKVESESESSDDEQTDYVTIKRKQQNKPAGVPSKEVESEEAEVPTEGKKKKKEIPKFFTAQEREDYKNAQKKAKDDYEARQAQREAWKTMTPAEKKAFRKAQAAKEKAEGGEDGFKSVEKRERRRRERKEGEEGEALEEEKRSRYPPREPDVAPPFENEYQTADMDSILNALTSYYRANPQANLSKPKAKYQPKAEAEVDAEEETKE